MPKVAMVTGGNRGIGLGITQRLLDEGYAVAILATREEPAELIAELRERGEVIYVRGSVAELADHQRYVDATLEAWGRIDVLVNNAGVAPQVRDDILVATPESYDRVMDINLRGPYFLTQLCARYMIDQKTADPSHNASIINVSSISATVASVTRGDYCISKAGVSMATQLWAARLGEYAIPVYEIRPGIIKTDMTAVVTQKYDALIADGLLVEPRWGTPDDVGRAVTALATGAMPYATGNIINIDGGLTVQRL